MSPEELQKVTELVQVLRDEVAQLKKFLNPVHHCEGITAKGTACRNKCVVGTKFCKKHTAHAPAPTPVQTEQDDDELSKLRKMLASESWYDQYDNDSLPELGEEFIR
jgi:hypothetical protein